MENEQMNLKKLYKDSAITALYIIGFLLLTSMIIGLFGTFYLKSNTNFFAFWSWTVGIVLNLLFLNTIGSFAAKVIFAFFITILIIYFTTKQKIRTLGFRASLIFVGIVVLCVSTFVGLITYLTSFIRVVEFSRDQAVFQLNPFWIFLKTFVKMIVIFVGIKLYSYDNEKLNSGLVAFKSYFYFMFIFSFIISVVLELYLFGQIDDLGFIGRRTTMLGLIMGVFNIMVYIVLFLFGGIAQFSTAFIKNTEVYKVSFIDFIKGDYGSLVLILFLIGFIVLIGIIFWAIRKINEEHFIRDVAIFVFCMLVFNGLLVVLSNLEVDVLIVKMVLSFLVIPVLVTTLVIVFAISILRYLIIAIKKSI